MQSCRSTPLSSATSRLRNRSIRVWLAALAAAPFVIACTGAVEPVGGGGSGASGAGSTGAGGATSGAGGSSGTPNMQGGSGNAAAASGGALQGGNPGAGGTQGTTGGTPGGSGAGTAAAEIPNKAIHRLGNVEYDNTLRDLTGTALRFGDTFASEEADGFDNLATALSMSPRQFEDYFVAAQQVSANVFAEPTLRSRIVKCTPDTTSTCAQTVIRDFGQRAFRRPLTAEESSGLLAKYEQAKTLGVDAMGALQHVVHIILSSPQFLYRIEFDPNLADPAPHPLSAYELASRLSYALWSSMPDDPLFAEAARGGLSTPDALRTQVERMLGDDRSEMLVKNFAAQWFGSKRLSEHVASATTYPAYTPALAASMQREMESYFSEFLYGERPYSEFLTADFNFVDAGLAALYGMSPPTGSGLTRVVNTTDGRSGLLGLAGFLTHTSRETRSSPIIRGKWILDAVWCMSLKLPTNLVVEPLPEPTEGSAPTTVREQMAAHRVSAACSGCHDLIDPIGLALEHFDGIGRYRAMYENGLPMDTTGVMPGGQPVDGLASLAAALTSNPLFMSCAATKFGTYALGLPFPSTDRDQIVGRWSAGQLTLRNLIKETVTHDAFRSRRAESP